MAIKVKDRIQVHQSWIGDIPLKNLWGISISNRDTGTTADIGRNIQDILNEYQPGAYSVEPDLIEKFTSSTAGFLLAQNIAMPKEGMGVNTADSIGNAGGFISGYIGSKRDTYGGSNIIDIEFLETNTDIFDFFIKPWIVATSFKGLIEDGSLDIKCNIDVMQYTRSDDSYKNKDNNQLLQAGASDYKLRKLTKFKNCAPIRVASDQMSYGQLSERDITRPVGWTFSHYEISNPYKG
ncbi:hypothetical protein N9Z65_00965 [bacterium]|nr:hypothetical protein [bacterium]